MARYLFEWTDFFGADSVESGSEVHRCNSLEEIEDTVSDILEELEDGHVFVYLHEPIYYGDNTSGMLMR